MTEKGCDNCYYTYFDERAYPCSLCIRGVERTDQWQPSRKTKADRKTEPLDKDINVRSKTEPQNDARMCTTCKYNPWVSKACQECKGGICDNYEPQTERGE